MNPTGIVKGPGAEALVGGKGRNGVPALGSHVHRGQSVEEGLSRQPAGHGLLNCRTA